MPQPERVPKLMQNHREHIDIRADLPTFVRIEVQVSRDWFGIGRSRKVGVCQHLARSIERIRVAVRTRGEQKVQVSGCSRFISQGKGDVRRLRPLRQGPLNLCGHLVPAELAGKRFKGIGQRRRSLSWAIPPVAYRGDILPDRTCQRQRACARIHRQTVNQVIGSRKYIRNLVPASQFRRAVQGSFH